MSNNEQQATTTPAQKPLSFIAPIKQPVAQHYKELKQILTHVDGKALDQIGTVHFGRFMFLERDTTSTDEVYTKFALFTAYDGDFKEYVQDFVDVVSEVFDALLEHLVDGESLIPVKKNAQAFADFVDAHNEKVEVWYSAYPTLSVVQILTNAKN
ncbi:hypothetical protein [Scytonema sp. HK-05]|uniref:hypothetical protein n=1 Tax=Scytonema sp. HK-05 TaxID=1137095 RepID=UPI0009369D27|nr:hypothetical protein [Scytonema sp. HK-05]OKH51457.1 hypothetical protein NIES2130_33740 [Scytonema sp. HK-05]